MHVDMLKFCHQIELREEAVPTKHPWGGRIPVTTQGVRKGSPPPHPKCSAGWYLRMGCVRESHCQVPWVTLF